MTSGSCSGRSHLCETSLARIAQALEGVPTAQVLDAVRAELAECGPCGQLFEVQIRFKLAMGQACRARAPESLQLRISRTLRRIDLGEVDVTDL